MSRILKALEPARFAEFTTLFAPHADVPHLIVTFLALLELAREQLVDDRAGGALRADLRAADRRPGLRAGILTRTDTTVARWTTCRR